MTTGYLDIRVADCRIYGDFANGVLQSGTIVKPNVTYNGRFNCLNILSFSFLTNFIVMLSGVEAFLYVCFMLINDVILEIKNYSNSSLHKSALDIFNLLESKVPDL